MGVTATANSQTFNTSANTDAANATTIAIGAFNTTITTGAAGDTFNTIQQDGSTITAGAGNDTFNITNVAAIDNDATLLTLTGGTGTDSLVFADALTVAADFTDTTDIAISGIETLNVGQVGGASTVTLSTANEFTTIIADTTNSTLVVTGTGSQLSEVTTLTNTNGGNVFSLTVSDAGATLDLDAVTLGGAGDLDVITFQATGSNVLRLDGADVSQISATAVAAGTADTLEIGVANASGGDAVANTTFNAFETITLVGTTALDLDLTDSGVGVARTINGDVGDNTINVGTPTATKTIVISSGGTDTVQIPMDTLTAGAISVTGFTPGTGGDILDLLTAAEGATNVTFTGPIAAAGVLATSNATDANTGYILNTTATQISGALATAVGDGGAVEAAMIAMGFTGTSLVNGQFLMAAIDNGTDTGIYRITANDTAIIDATDMDGITHIATLVGVTTDQLVPANVI